MSSKQAILARVRNALKTPTDANVRHEQPIPRSSDLPIVASRQFLPPVGESFESQCDLFAEISEKLKTEFLIVDQLKKASQTIRQLASELGWS